MTKMRWMVLSVVGMLALGGCSGHHHHYGMEGGKSDAYWQKGQQDMAGLVDRTMKDPAKAAQVKAIVGEIVTELKAGREQERTAHRQLYALSANYAATAEEFTKVMDEANNQRTKTSSKILALRFKMKDLMTAEEWKALSDQMLSYSSKYQHGSAAPTSSY
jgi:Spy/CpxP family protein refolding chaperone